MVKEAGGLGVEHNPKGNVHDGPKIGAEDGGGRGGGGYSVEPIGVLS